MEILSINADQKLINITSAIGSNPERWLGWHCLEVKLQDVDENLYQDGLLWTKSIVESYLKNVEERVYFCANKAIHILCKVTTPQMLHQIGQQICDLIYADDALAFHYTVYDLGQSGFMYAQHVLEQVDDVLALHSPHNTEQESSRNRQLSQQKPSTGDVKVLLIEDDPIASWMVSNALQDECEFSAVSSVSKTFSIYNTYQPDVVFLDINLPDGSGTSVLEWIMRNDPGACVVMFSGNDLWTISPAC